MTSKERGSLGEKLALEFLINMGFVTVAKGWRSRFGEIDLIVKNSEYIVFVEVKLRKNADFAAAREFVGKTKQDKLRATAKLWLASHKTDLQPRFDVMEVYMQNESSMPEINHIINAF